LARPQKEGLEYFPIVTSFDDKINLIIAEFGPEGLGIIIGLFQRIYINGYYVNWNEDTLMLFATKHVNTEITRVNVVLTKCLQRNIFNEELYSKYGILTSRGIQKQYLKVCKDSRRKSVQFIKEYCLVVNDELTKVITELISVITEETPKNVVLSTQRKEKKRKEKKSKEYTPFLSDSNEYRLSFYLFNFIKKNNEKAKEPNFQSWCKEFDKILRIDKREVEEIKKIIKWCQEDDFWCKNILSPTNLRKHYDKFVLEIKAPTFTKKGKTSNDDNLNKRDFDTTLESKLLGEDKGNTKEEETFDNKKEMERLKKEAMNKGVVKN